MSKNYKSIHPCIQSSSHPASLTHLISAASAQFTRLESVLDLVDVVVDDLPFLTAARDVVLGRDDDV